MEVGNKCLGPKFGMIFKYLYKFSIVYNSLFNKKVIDQGETRKMRELWHLSGNNAKK